MKLKYDNLLSSFAFKFNLRRYIQYDVKRRAAAQARAAAAVDAHTRQGLSDGARHVIDTLFEPSFTGFNGI